MDKPKFVLESSLVIAIGTGCLYSINYLYLCGYFSCFGLNPLELDLDVAQVLSANPLAVLFMALVVSYALKTLVRSDFNLMNKSHPVLGISYLILSFVIFGLASFAIGTLKGKQAYSRNDNYVSFDLNGLPYRGYRYLGLYKERMLVFKPTASGFETLSIKVDKIDSYAIGMEAK